MSSAPLTSAHKRASQRRNFALAQVEELENRIRLGQLRPGEKLPTEAALMQAFSVNRTVVREASSKLQASGPVQTHQGIGTFVWGALNAKPFTVNGGDSEDLARSLAKLELLAGLESESTALAAQRRTMEDLTHIRSAYSTFRLALTQHADTAFADFEFHVAMARAAHSPHFASALEALGPTAVSSSLLWRTYSAPESAAWGQEVLAEQANTIDAIERQDADAARAATRIHLVKSRERRPAA